MSKVNDGGLAFPVADPAWLEPKTTDEAMRAASGMTLRDYFAAKAMQGLLANPKLAPEIVKRGGCSSGWIEGTAFGFADGMLAAREGK